VLGLRLASAPSPVSLTNRHCGARDDRLEPLLAVLAEPHQRAALIPPDQAGMDPEQEYFADGVVEDIITALSNFRSLFVIARNSSFTFKGKTINIKQVGRELGVRYVLEGSTRKSAARVRITGQLIEASMSRHLNSFCGLLSRRVFACPSHLRLHHCDSFGIGQRW
jgi:TolB-like protein